MNNLQFDQTISFSQCNSKTNNTLIIQSFFTPFKRSVPHQKHYSIPDLIFLASHCQSNCHSQSYLKVIASQLLDNKSAKIHY